MAKLSGCIITLGEPCLGTAINSLRELVDEIVVVDTRKDKSTPLDVASDVKVFPFDWIDDFSAAREFSFSKASNEYCVWLDSDEELLNGRQLRDVFEEAATFNEPFQIILPTNYAQNDYGETITLQMRERIVPKSQGRWHGEIHEVWCPREPIRNLAPKGIGIFHAFRPNTPEGAAKRRRNLEILERVVKSGDKRLRVQYAMALMAENRLKDALTILRAIAPTEPRGWSRARSYMLLARALIMSNKWSEASACASLALDQVPGAIEPLRMMFDIACCEERFRDALDLFRRAYESGMPVLYDATVWEPQILEAPYSAAALCAVNLDDFELGLAYAKKAKDADLIKKIEGAILEDKVLDGLGHLLEQVSDKAAFCRQLPAAYQKFPSIARILAPELPTDRPTIAIHCGMEGMGGGKSGTWGPDSIKEGIGGSEEAVIRITPCLAREAHVEVFGPWADEVRDGVYWRNYTAFDPDRPYDTFIAWRYTGLLKLTKASGRKVLWLHDAVGEQLLGDPDEIWCLSQYHADWVRSIRPDANIWITANGIGEMPTGTKKPIVITASSPDRGVRRLLEWWPEIRRQVPEAELHCYYGFNDWYLKREKTVPGLVENRLAIEKLVKQPGVRWFGTVGQDQLHEAFAEAKVWAYPTDFNEISCITAIKAQAAGAIPVCSSYAALDETVQHGIKIGSVTDPDIAKHKPQFIAAVVKALRGGYDRLVPLAQEYGRGRTWDGIAREWIARIAGAVV